MTASLRAAGWEWHRHLTFGIEFSLYSFVPLSADQYCVVKRKKQNRKPPRWTTQDLVKVESKTGEEV